MDICNNSSEKLPNSDFDLKYFPQTDVLVNALNQMFPEQLHEDKTVQKVKEILGEKYTTEDVKTLIASFEYLIANWLIEYERKVFNNMTLKELLQFN
ncbi:MAG: hypothetical protein M3Q44_03750 [bacterium]|nr:hypothetical protein [bacterium]